MTLQDGITVCEQFNCPGLTEPAHFHYTVTADVTDQTGTLENLEVREHFLESACGKARSWGGRLQGGQDHHPPPVPHHLQADHSCCGAPSERPCQASQDGCGLCRGTCVELEKVCCHFNFSLFWK